jgi:hypothetical protein
MGGQKQKWRPAGSMSALFSTADITNRVSMFGRQGVEAVVDLPSVDQYALSIDRSVVQRVVADMK